MLKIVLARIFGALLCVAVAAAAWPATSHAIDGAEIDSIDVSEQEIMPPNSGDETRGEAGADAPRDNPSSRDSAGSPSASPANPTVSDTAAKNSAREAAKRALFSDPTKDKDKPNPYLDVRGPDYYDLRAKQMLKDDADTGKVNLHPLMEAHPESFVVVCSAGCPQGRGDTIVSMLPRPAVTQTPASQPDALVNGNVISCVAGCGADGTTLMAGTSTAGGTAMAATVGEWMTTVAKVPASADAPAPKPAASGEWMGKINQERASQQQTAPKPMIDTPVQAQKTEPKPELKPASKQAAAVEAPKAATAVEPKAPVVAEAKPATPAGGTKPAPAITSEVTPAPVATPPAAKPATSPVDPKPAPVVTAEVTPAPAATPPAASPAAAKPAATISDKTVVSVEAKPTAVPAETKLSDREAKPVASPPQQMAALETPKASPVAPVSKPDGAAQAVGNNTSLPKDDGTKVAAVTPPAVEKPAPAVPAKQKDGVISVLSEDKDMNAAIQKARGSLSSFWKSYETPASGEADHALKVAVAGNGTTEHFWLTRIKREGGKISGVISNQPQSVTTVKVGQRYEFTEDMISDWTFKRNGKLVGNETMRVLLPRMPEEQAAVYRKMYETP